MCLLVVASQLVPGEPLIVGANRDEVLDRPSTAVTVLDEGPPRVLGGRDEQSGGTWLAVNRDGVCAGLTNQPLGDAKDPTKRSRGELPLAAARRRRRRRAVESWCGTSTRRLQRRLAAGGRPRRRSTSWTSPAPASVAVELAPGIHVLENRSVGRALAQGGPGAAGLRRGRSRAGRRGRHGVGVPARAGRPPDPRGGRASERGELRASRHVRDPVVVHRARGGAAGRSVGAASDVGGRRAACSDEVVTPRGRGAGTGRATSISPAARLG